MTSSSWALKAAIKAALAGDASLITLLGTPVPVHDRVPDGAALPYIAFGDWSVEESDTDDIRVDAHVILIDAWSSYAGTKQAKAIAGAIELALHGAALTLEDHVLIYLSFTGAAFSQDALAGLSRATLRFRAMTQANE